MSGRDVAISLLRAYKRWISPWLPAACRFEPTCSEYAREAIEIHGFWGGSLLTVKRLLRCQPFSRGGFDPVPPPRGPHAADDRDLRRARGLRDVDG